MLFLQKAVNWPQSLKKTGEQNINVKTHNIVLGVLGKRLTLKEVDLVHVLDRQRLSLCPRHGKRRVLSNLQRRFCHDCLNIPETGSGDR